MNKHLFCHLKAASKASFFILFLAGCSPTQNTAQQAQERMNTTLTSWVGRNVAEFSVQYGRPIDIVKTSNNTAVFRWTSYSQSAGGIVPIGGMMAVVPPRQFACNVRLTAVSKNGSSELRNWTIQRYQFDGYC